MSTQFTYRRTKRIKRKDGKAKYTVRQKHSVTYRINGDGSVTRIEKSYRKLEKNDV